MADADGGGSNNITTAIAVTTITNHNWTL